MAPSASSSKKDAPVSVPMRLVEPGHDPASAEETTTVTSIGIPRNKPMWEKSDLAAIAMSFACLGIAVAVLQRNRAVSWRLGFNGQIIVIGFLLSTVQFVTRKIASTAFLILESRWGSSSLQNYDAILRNGIFLSYTGLGCRTIIALFTFLPLALSVGYKRFTGGVSSVLISSPWPAYSSSYGVSVPPLGEFGAFNNSIY